jgi:hypothetical protein
MEESYSGSCACAAVYPLSSSQGCRLIRDLFCGEEHGTSTPLRAECGHWFEDIEPIALGAAKPAAWRITPRNLLAMP